MVNTAHTYNSGNVVVGPADVFVNVQNPTSAVPPTAGTNTWSASGTYAISAAGLPTDNGSAGVHIGLCEGPAMVQVTPKFLEIRADQYATPVDAAFISTDTEIDFVVEEVVLQNLTTFLSSSLGTYTNVGAGANPACDFLQFGSQPGTNVTFISLLLISPDHAVAGKFWIVNGYKCYLKSAIQSTFARATKTTWKLKFGCVSDVSRVAGDMTMQIVRTL